MSRPRPIAAHLRALWTAVVVTALWSSSWVLIRIGLDDEALEPVTFAGLRYGVAAAVLVGWTASSPLRHEAHRLRRSDIGRLAVLGVVFYTVTQGAQFVAIDSQPAATTSLVLSLTPLAVALLAARSVGERATRRQVAGGALVATGASLYFAGDLGATTVGMAAAALALAANVTSALLGRAVNRGGTISPIVVTTVSMSVGAALLLGIGLATEGWPALTPRAWLIVGWLAVVNTAVAFTLWNRSLRHLSAVESAGINNTMLVQIALLAWIFLDEAPGALALLGIVTVSTGVLFTQTAVTTRPVPTPDEAA